MIYAIYALSGASLLAWIALILARGRFWWPSPRLDHAPPRDGHLATDEPSVAAVIPARDEAAILPTSLPSVLRQDYAGMVRIVLVDDNSKDGTAAVAVRVAERTGRRERLAVHRGTPLPPGWSGKVWAMAQGAARAGSVDYLWFTDADIAHEPWVLDALVGLAESRRLDLVSTMATLRVDSAWDRLLVPAFVYFFAKLYPFRFVGNPKHRAAGAAGGCVLVRRDVLEAAGGFAGIRGALIDDCALARLVKTAGGRLWLGFSRGVQSVRSYGSLRSVWDMVARSAYTQLGHSPLNLAGTVLAMLLLYAWPPLAALAGAVAAGIGVVSAVPVALAAGVTWCVLAASFVPMLRHHGVSAATAPLLPAAGILYAAMTVSSAWRHTRGRGGAWKGRSYSLDD